MFSLLEDLYLNINVGDVAAAVFCDYCKAFDCVNHEILLDKLSRYGFRGVALQWFKSFLSGRRQVVRSMNVLSDECSIGHGVPQGSVLGPILFLLYINDLATLDIRGHFTIFADDTTILWSHNDHESLVRIISEDLVKIKQWCDANLLSLNISKTKLVSFKFVCNDKIKIQDEPLEINENNRFLGILLDNSLKFHNHILALREKLASGCYAVRVVAKELGPEAAKLAYFSLVESHMRYGIAFWGCCSQYLFNSVFILQKRAIRYVCRKTHRETYRPLFKDLKVLTLCCLFILETTCLIYKKFGMQLKGNLNKPYNTRQNFNIPLPIPRTELTRNSLIY